MDTENLKGRHGTYAVTARRPFAFGRVSVLYEATSPSGTSVAAKLFNQEPRNDEDVPALPEFFRELEAQTQLAHPNILPILDFGSGANDEPFVIYPYCQAGDLRRFMRDRQYVPLNEALPILEQVAAAIDFAHSRGFIHGDVKPENVLFIQKPSHACLADFGMARHFAFTSKVSTKQLDSQGGSAAYLSPEELADGRQSPRSDLYAFGLVAYQLLTGTLPFEMNAPLFRQIQAKVEGRLLDPAEANPVLPASAVRALRSILSVAPASRPATASTFCALLKGHGNVPVAHAETRVGVDAPSPGFWSSLDAKSKAGVIGAGIAGLAGIITALIKVLPALLK
jgi:serine/threonine protein kinase